MVDIEEIKAFIMFSQLFENYEKGKSFSRTLILQDLGMSLVNTLIVTRQTEWLSKYIIQNIRLNFKNADDHAEKRDEIKLLPSVFGALCVLEHSKKATPRNVVSAINLFEKSISIS